VTWLTLGLFAKRVGTGVITWLTHASFWQFVAIGLLCLAVVQHFELAHSRKDAAAYLKQRDAYKAQLDSISSKRDVQRQVTRDRLVTVTRVIKEADGRAEKVEKAPLPGRCRTPPEISQADL
jgi:hypothetical protein